MSKKKKIVTLFGDELDAFDCVLLLIPLGLVLKITECAVVLLAPELLPTWAALFVGLLVGFVVTRAVSGSTFKEFMVPAVLLFLAFVLLPVFARSKEVRLRRAHHAPHARVQAPTKTPQR